MYLLGVTTCPTSEGTINRCTLNRSKSSLKVEPLIKCSHYSVLSSSSIPGSRCHRTHSLLHFLILNFICPQKNSSSKDPSGSSDKTSLSSATSFYNLSSRLCFEISRVLRPCLLKTKICDCPPQGLVFLGISSE